MANANVTRKVEGYKYVFLKIYRQRIMDNLDTMPDIILPAFT